MGEGNCKLCLIYGLSLHLPPVALLQVHWRQRKRCLLAGHQALLKGNHPMRQHQLNHYLISSKCSGRAGQKQQVEQRGTLSSAPIYLSLTPTNYCIYQATGTPLWPPILSYFSLSRNLCTTSAAPLYSTAISLLVPNSCPDHYLSLSSHL